MNAIFQVNRSFVSTGLLKDYGMALVEISDYDGTQRATNMANRDVWLSVYGSLRLMKFNNNATLPTPATVNSTLAGFATTENGLPLNNLLALHYNYEQFKTNAATGNLVYVQNGKIYDRANRPTTPYEIKSAFCMAPQNVVLTGGTQLFRFRNELFFKNVTKTISSIQADFSDGAGFRMLSANASQSVTYTTQGLKTLQFKITYTDGTVMQSRSQVLVTGIVTTAPPAARYVNANDVPTPGSIDPLPKLGFSYPAVADMGTGDASIFFSGNDQVLDKPLIIVEGFDPNNIRTYPEIFTEIRLGVEIEMNGVKKRFYNYLDENGYDLIFLNFANGGGDIKRNARLLENLIQHVNARKVGTEKNIVMGVSMGGLIVRYALRDMEMNGLAHQTRLWGSFDSPHLGANFPLGLQGLVRYLSGIKLDGVPLNDITTLLGGAINTVTSPAAQQMLIYQLQGTGATTAINTNSPHQALMSELTSMGFPQQGGIRSIAVSNGSECGTNQGFEPYATYLVANRTRGLTHLARLGAAQLAANTILSVSTVGGTDNGNYPTFNEDLTTALYPVAALLISSSHLEVTAYVKGMPNQQVLPVFSINAKAKINLLFGLLKREKEVLNFVINSQSTMLPLDSSPGGSADVLDFVNSATLANGLPAGLSIFNTKFGFIPTPSSLNAGSGAQPLTTAHINSPYSRAIPPTGMLTVPFDNFFSNPVANEKHAQVTNKNGVWLLHEFQGDPKIFSCNFACPATTGFGMDILGTNTVCNTENTVTLTNLPVGVTPVWSVSPNINLLSGQGTTKISVNRNSSGSGFIKVIVNDGKCDDAVLQLNVRVGGYSSGDYPVIGPTTVCAGQTVGYSTNNLLGATNYDWIWPSSWTYVSGEGTQYLAVIPTNTGPNGAVGVRVANACDAGSSPSVLYVSTSSCGMFSLTLSPNPASSTMTAELIEQEPTDNQIEEIDIVDGNGASRLKSSKQGKKVELNVSNLRKGYHYVRVRINGEVTVARIMIE